MRRTPDSQSEFNSTLRAEFAEMPSVDEGVDLNTEITTLRDFNAKLFRARIRNAPSQF